MPTNRKRVSRKMVISEEPLTECLRYYFLHGKYGPRPGAQLPGLTQVFRMRHPASADRFLEAWKLHRAEILREWKLEKRKGKCWGQKNLD